MVTMKFIAIFLCFSSIIRAELSKPVQLIAVNSPQLNLIDIGEDVNLSCESYGYKENANTFWLKDNGSLPKKSFQSNGVLSIPNFQPEDSGLYKCRLQSWHKLKNITLAVKHHILETTSKSNTFEMLPTPSPPCRASIPNFKLITIQPATFSTHPGDILVLACHNAINSNASITWKKAKNSRLPAHIIIRNGILIIKSVSVEDSGRYSCESVGEYDIISDVADVYINPDQTKPTEVPTTISTSENILANRFLPITTETSVRESNSKLSPQLTISPNLTEVTLYEGDRLSLVCTVKTVPDLLLFSWSKPNQDIYHGNSSSHKIEILNVRFSDEGVYTCLAINKVGLSEKSIKVLVRFRTVNSEVRTSVPTGDPTTASISTNLHEIPSSVTEKVKPVYNPSVSDEEPQFINTPNWEYKIRLGERVKISCEIGKSNENAIWKRQDGRPLPSNSHLSGNDLIIIEAKKDAVGIYECSKWDEMNGGYSFQTVKLTIFEITTNTPITVNTPFVRPRPPHITISPNSSGLTLYQGDELHLVCSADGYPAPEVQWKKNTLVLIQGDGSSAILHKSNVGLEDQGTYVCSTSNTVGKRLKPIKISVRPNPPFQFKVSLGDGVKISCEIENDSKTPSWRRADRHSLPSNSRLSDSDLIIDPVQRDAAGIYECVVHENNGVYPIATAEIIIADPPQITISPKMPLKVGTGEEARVYCYTKGDKPITIEWHYEGNRPLPNNVEAIDNYLQFDNISMGNGGRYHCTVTNRHGRTTKAAELIVTYNEPICNENEFQCNDGSCISSHYRCDKAQARHCPDGEDEVGCPRRGGCSPEEFRCTDGSCIDRTKLCNDFADCTGGEDEDNRNCLRQPNYNIRNQWYPRQGH